MEEGQSRQYTDIFESTMQGTGRRYGKTGKTLGAALKDIFRLLEQKNYLLFFWPINIGNRTYDLTYLKLLYTNV